MITDNIKHYLLALCVGCGSAASFTACSEWDEHYEDPVTQANSSLTLWQTIQQHPELSDFSEVLSNTMLLKQHKKTDVSYADMLNGSQSFTVFAPVNGSFDKDALISQLATDSGDSAVIRSFVGNHLSYGPTSSVATPTEFFLLNTKRATVGNGKVLGSTVKEENLSAKGGLLHILERPLPYRYNIYETLLNDSRFTTLGQLLNSYDKDEFSPSQSIPGGMVDGEQVYIDSVFNETNIMLDRVGKIAAEDSAFIMVVPTATEWERVWAEAQKCYHFVPSLEGADSLQRFWAAYSLFSDAIFSRKIQSSPEDSLITYNYTKRYPKYHVFHKPFDEGGILYGATPEEYSNGTLYVTDHWPFAPETTFQREIKVEAENTANVISKNSNCNDEIYTHIADSVSESGYLYLKPITASDWEMTFNLQDVLSGTYDICAIILPVTVANPVATTHHPCKFRATLAYVDEKGASKTLKCTNPNPVTTDKKEYIADSLCVDTVVIVENFTFPATNYDQKGIQFSLKIGSSVLNSEMIETAPKKYTRDMLLDCIYLRPKKRVEE